jgi:hypothetical protein
MTKGFSEGLVMSEDSILNNIENKRFNKGLKIECNEYLSFIARSPINEVIFAGFHNTTQVYVAMRDQSVFSPVMIPLSSQPQCGKLSSSYTYLITGQSYCIIEIFEVSLIHQAQYSQIISLPLEDLRNM